MDWGEIIGTAIAGGVAGGANARVDQLKKEAEQARAENMLRLQSEIRRDDATFSDGLAIKREDKKYERDRADQLADMDTEAVNKAAEKASDRDYNKGLLAEAREHDLSSYDAKMKISQKYKDPSESDKKMAKLDKMLANGDITPEEYKNNVLGVSKTSGFTQKDMANAWEGAYKQAAKERESDMKFQEMPIAEQQKALNARAGELVQMFTGASSKASGRPEKDGEPQSKESLVSDLANIYSKLPADKRQAFLSEAKTKFPPNIISDAVNMVGDKEKSSSPKVTTPERSIIDRKVEMQILAGDSREPGVIAEEIRKPEQGLMAEAKSKEQPDRQVEDINSLPPKVKDAIVRQAMNIKNTEGGNRSLESIIQAILVERAKGK